MAGKVDVSRLPRTVALERGADGAPELVLLDQRLLPAEERTVRLRDWRAAVAALRALAGGGAPASGGGGAAAVALAAWERAAGPEPADAAAFLAGLEADGAAIAQARPTAVNLPWAVGRALGEARRLAAAGEPPRVVAEALADLAVELAAADEAANRALGAHGAALLPCDATILTHCNAGSLATAFYGTALGVVYAAAERGGVARVFADETRPVGQGARLTAWELARAGVPVTLICDDMAASLLASGAVDAVVVGADRVAANGDAANKIGTLGVAVLADRYGVPFYVAAPTSTVDLAVPDGAAIPIEERDPAEVLPAPIPGVDVWNPAFDVTPAGLITAIITERGAFAPADIARACA